MDLPSVKNEKTAAKLRQRLVPGRVLLNDADWGTVRSTLKGKLSIGLRPFENAVETWHFYRHDFAACGVTDWEMLETLALAGRDHFHRSLAHGGFSAGPARGRHAEIGKVSGALEMAFQSANAEENQDLSLYGRMRREH